MIPSTPTQSALRIAAMVEGDVEKLMQRVEFSLGNRPGPDDWFWVDVRGIDVEAWFRVKGIYEKIGWEVTVDAFGMKLRPLEISK